MQYAQYNELITCYSNPNKQTNKRNQTNAIKQLTGWIPSQGDQIGKQIIASTVAALKAKEKYVEVLFDPVPNLDEVAFGTEVQDIFNSQQTAWSAGDCMYYKLRITIFIRLFESTS